MNNYLAASQPTTEAVARGLNRVWKQTAEEVNMIDHARQVALGYLRDDVGTGVAIPEADLIAAVMNSAPASKYLATYVVDELRGRGELTKNWRTGDITAAPIAPDSTSSTR